MSVSEDAFGVFLDERGVAVPVRRFTLANKRGVRAQLIDYGATLTALHAPDRNAHLADVTLGFDDMDGYTKNWVNPYFGAVVGRVANRVGGARFCVKGHTSHVSKNAGDNHLHGGFKGFDKKMWEANVEGAKVTFSYLSADGEEGYPGSLLVHATYWLSEGDDLHLEMRATCTKPTPVNLTNHAYFNLAGHDAGAAALKEHQVYVNADAYTPAVDTIPTGEIRSVGGSIFDLRTPRILKDVMPHTPEGGYDSNLCVNQTTPASSVLVARVVHPGSGRVLEVHSDQPGVQLYTSNNLPAEDILKGKGGAFYAKHAAFCLETQNYPDAVNQPNFPNSVLLPSQVYTHNVRYHFAVQSAEQPSSCVLA